MTLDTDMPAATPMPETLLSAEDVAGLVERPIRYVKQGDETGCAMACVAMVLGITYEEARERFGDPGNGWSPYRWEEELSRAGWAWQFYWRGDQRTNSRRDPWPLAPWADLHMLGVRDGRHQAIMLRDGTVLDPWDEGRRSLDFYGPDDIAWMAAVYPVDQTATTISTLAARVEEAEREAKRDRSAILAREALAQGLGINADRTLMETATMLAESELKWKSRALAAEAETARMRKALEEANNGLKAASVIGLVCPDDKGGKERQAAVDAARQAVEDALSPASENGGEG